jgi:hypothetical protein
MNQSEDTASAYVQGHKDRSIDVSKVAHQPPHPAGMIPDTFVKPSTSTRTSESGSRSPIDVSFRPLILNVGQGVEDGEPLQPVVFAVVDQKRLREP